MKINKKSLNHWRERELWVSYSGVRHDEDAFDGVGCGTLWLGNAHQKEKGDKRCQSEFGPAPKRLAANHATGGPESSNGKKIYFHRLEESNSPLRHNPCGKVGFAKPLGENPADPLPSGWGI